MRTFKILISGTFIIALVSLVTPLFGQTIERDGLWYDLCSEGIQKDKSKCVTVYAFYYDAGRAYFNSTEDEIGKIRIGVKFYEDTEENHTTFVEVQYDLTLSTGNNKVLDFSSVGIGKVGLDRNLKVKNAIINILKNNSIIDDSWIVSSDLVEGHKVPETNVYQPYYKDIFSRSGAHKIMRLLGSYPGSLYDLF